MNSSHEKRSFILKINILILQTKGQLIQPGSKKVKKKKSNLTRPRRCVKRKSVVCPFQVKKNPLILALALSHYILSQLSSSSAALKLSLSFRLPRAFSLSCFFLSKLCFKSIFLPSLY